MQRLLIVSVFILAIVASSVSLMAQKQKVYDFTENGADNPKNKKHRQEPEVSENHQSLLGEWWSKNKRPESYYRILDIRYGQRAFQKRYDAIKYDFVDDRGADGTGLQKTEELYAGNTVHTFELSAVRKITRHNIAIDFFNFAYHFSPSTAPRLTAFSISGGLGYSVRLTEKLHLVPMVYCGWGRHFFETSRFAGVFDNTIEPENQTWSVQYRLDHLMLRPELSLNQLLGKKQSFVLMLNAGFDYSLHSGKVSTFLMTRPEESGDDGDEYEREITRFNPTYGGWPALLFPYFFNSYYITVGASLNFSSNVVNH